MKRPWRDRLLDRLWSEIGQRKELDTAPPATHSDDSGGTSVSGTMDWPLACAALVEGTWTRTDFRRRRAVRQVVETLAPSDARRFARWIRETRPNLLRDPRIRRANDWGDPLMAPSWVLGTTDAWSPTSLRYLAHALWLEESGRLPRSGTVVEIGVGFGGLAAMNAVVSDASTVLVDLPPVERAAALQMRELGLADHVLPRRLPDDEFCLVSNYAFTELTKELQDQYIDEFARHAASGVIVSNASVFSQHIGGRSDDELIACLRDAGIDASLATDAPILGPSDAMFRNTVISWRREARRGE